MLINQVQAYLPPITFEQPGYVSGSTVGLAPGSGWSLISGNASVSPIGTGASGGQALKLENNPQQEPLLKREVNWDISQKVAFIDLKIKPAADPQGSLASFYANGTQLAFQVPTGGNTGEIWVYNGSAGIANTAQWAKTVGTFTLNGNGLTASDYTRITLRHDYQRNVWDLFINSKLAAANLAFEGRGANLQNIELYGSKVGDTLIDDLSADPNNMLFPDADKDGLPDAWETANGSNPNLYDRDALKLGTNSSFLDLYLNSLWSGGLNASNPLPAQGTIPPITILGGHQPVTSLKGSLSVGGDGSSSYTMPIDIPKGTAGMEPKISLNYSSSGGNGIAGLGWSIGGLQSITRGTATAAKDGFAGTMNFDTNDRFFFNGERLVCVAGNYGEQNSEYRTEIDSFARITLKGGNQNSSAAWWQVETKAGLIIELGNTSDSKVSVPTVNAPITWDVSKVSDTVGNYYLVKWTDTRAADNSTLDNRRLDKISYTGTTSSAPYCDIAFQYETRPDTSFAYTPKGLKMTNTLRLKSVAVKTDSLVNHSYVLNYERSNQSSRSLLKYVFKQQPDGSTTNPTVFDWAGP
jgi:Salmonella virulence plasmid 65kDa B protein